MLSADPAGQGAVCLRTALSLNPVELVRSGRRMDVKYSQPSTSGRSFVLKPPIRVLDLVPSSDLEI